MKKQIFLLIVTFMVSANLAWGQTSPQTTETITLASGESVVCPTINPVTCGVDGDLAEELQPIIGKEYTYSVTVTPNETTDSPTYHWFVTDAQTFINESGIIKTGADPGTGAGDYVMASGTGYLDEANATEEITITWKSWATTEPVFLVIYVEGEDGCTDNLQAWKIDPRNSFTLDLANIADDGSAQGDAYATCVSRVQSAIYNTTEEVIDMDYGTNYLFFAVKAGNFGDAWKPSVELTLPTDYATNRTIAVDWAYSADAGSDANWNPMTLASGIYESAAADYALSNDYDEDYDGSCIVIRVTIEHLAEESLANVTIGLAVDGEMFSHDGTNFVSQGNDVHYDDWTPDTGSTYSGDCGTEDGFENDRITQILEARPTIEEDTPGADTFVPKN